MKNNFSKQKPLRASHDREKKKLFTKPCDILSKS